ncbi:FliA/WhiG family RNA polymerase sigma factor [Conexibacter woesei]|uniref:RNA polymerase, sigma 28 subunit, FliA/WhiG n=1 Tax=Conexibacter woesei (strain DSM 14684 / CCUG 47730 / CIP 108061 / JCM 11494 / NBRC 100937 / ID131577) TaxID=469383 RepID=D3F725_CONWI|nr:FliA/WhiG family RNA polymerase sigma factor [Conexibacter woesei]ADB48796.1 RNA polymerase, sigma 28 subunit, FliA/WhiG [Conexibacter woesei DSM 14684]
MTGSTRRIVLAERWRRYKGTGERAARDDLVLAYSPIVKYVAGRVAARMPAHVDVADLISDGFKGLLDAVERFEPVRGVRFEAYADTRIRGAIFDGLRSLDWVPRAVRAEAREIERATAELAMRLQRMPTDPELAGALSMSRRQLAASLQRVSDSRIVALDEPWGPVLADGRPVALLDTLPDLDAVDPAADSDETERSERIGAAVRQLPAREQVVLGLRYHHDLTLLQIGEVLGISESRTSQLHTKAALQLKAVLATDRAPVA